jgi:hypothetical protein
MMLKTNTYNPTNTYDNSVVWSTLLYVKDRQHQPKNKLRLNI